MSSFGFMHTNSASDPAAAGVIGWWSALFGWTATIFFLAWILATVQSHDPLAYGLFCAFALSMVAALGLAEERNKRRR